jgi:hypothetical protein
MMMTRKRISLAAVATMILLALFLPNAAQSKSAFQETENLLRNGDFA